MIDTLAIQPIFLTIFLRFFVIFHDIFLESPRQGIPPVRHTSDCVKRGYALYEGRLYAWHMGL
jgi:hypothetical protein